MQSSVFFSYSGKKLLSVSPSFKDMLYMYCNLVTINIFMSIKRSIAFYKKKIGNMALLAVKSKIHHKAKS